MRHPPLLNLTDIVRCRLIDVIIDPIGIQAVAMRPPGQQRLFCGIVLGIIVLRHPWKAEATEGDKKVGEETIKNWYESVYEPNYAAE